MAILYLHSSLCRSFKLIVLKLFCLTILALVGPTSTVLQEYRQELNNRLLFCQISIVSAIYMMSLNITAKSQQTKLSWAVKYTSID